jgi:hypothetical protein
MTIKDKDTMIESILSIRRRIDKYTGRERHIFLVACRANIRLARLFQSKSQFIFLPEYEEYSRFVDEQLDKSASTLPAVMPALQIESGVSPKDCIGT